MMRLFLPIVCAVALLGPVQPYRGGERVNSDAQVATLGLTWHYNYTPSTAVTEGEFVPMIRDEAQLARLPELAGYTGWVLGFNEPGVEGQAETLDTPLKIARAWRQVEQALPNAKLVSPAFMENGGLPWEVTGYPTFAGFVAAYRAEYGQSPRIDALAVHVYGWCRNGQHDAERMAQYVRDRRAEAVALGYNVPVWITEFGLFPWPGQTYSSNDVMILQREFAARVRGLAYVERICWFPTVPAPGWPDVLWNGGLTQLGEQYRSLEIPE